MVERLGFSMKAVKTDEPEGIKYLGKQAFDFFCPTWRGVAYIHIGKPAGVKASGTWDDPDTFTKIEPMAVGTPVSVVNTVTTKVDGTVTTSTSTSA